MESGQERWGGDVNGFRETGLLLIAVFVFVCVSRLLYDKQQSKVT